MKRKEKKEKQHEHSLKDFLRRKYSCRENFLEKESLSCGESFLMEKALLLNS